MNILDTIMKYRTSKGWTEYQLAEKSGLPQSTISSWYRRNLTPSIQSLEKICTAFDITLSQFFASDDEVLSLTTQQKRLLSYWIKLDSHYQEAFLQMLATMADERNKESE